MINLSTHKNVEISNEITRRKSMYYRLLFCIFIFLFPLVVHGKEKKVYPLTNDPIDVVIVTHPKDKETLNDCICGIRENCKEVRRVIVVSSEVLTEEAEFFCEDQFPFTIEEIAMAIVRGDKKKRVKFFYGKHRTPGWYFQQCLKLYASLVIPDISPNVLILDSDTCFMNEVKFLNESNGGLFCLSTKRPKPSYFEHARRLVPGYKRMNPQYYSVCHHMLFQRPILEDLFKAVEEHHGKPFWKAFCHCVDTKDNRGGSEFEIYYSYAHRNTDQVESRMLKWDDKSEFGKKDQLAAKGYHFCSFHTYLRNKKKKIIKP